MMSTLQVHASDDVPTPFAILSDTQINPDSETRSSPSHQISSKYSSKIFSDDESDQSDLELGENRELPPFCSSPSEDTSSDDEIEREIDPSLKQQVEQLYQLMQLDKVMSSRPQELKQIVEEESSSDGEEEEMRLPYVDTMPREYTESDYEAMSDESDDDDLILPETIIKKPSLKLKPAIVKKTPSPKHFSDKKKFWNQLQELKQNSIIPDRHHSLANVRYYVATPEKTSKTCSICKKLSNSIQHMQGVTWWGDKRKYFDFIDGVSVDVCSTCFDFWVVKHSLESAKGGFLERTRGTTHIIRRPEVKDFFSSPKPLSVYVQV